MTEIQETAAGTGTCKRPGCGKPLPASSGRVRHRVFCGDGCARRYHNDARLLSGDRAGSEGHGDPLGEAEGLLRQLAVLVKAGREQAAGLDPARVRADLADAEAARRRAEAAVVTAQARQGEAESEAQALGEALAAAREDLAVAQDAARTSEAAAREAENRADEAARDCARQVAEVRADADGRVAQARALAEDAGRERDEALESLREARTAAEAEVGRARQAEADARAEIQRVRDDAGRERDALRGACEAQVVAQRALTDAERARAERAEAQLEAERVERRQLTTHIAGDVHGKAAGVERHAGFP